MTTPFNFKLTCDQENIPIKWWKQFMSDTQIFPGSLIVKFRGSIYEPDEWRNSLSAEIMITNFGEYPVSISYRIDGWAEYGSYLTNDHSYNHNFNEVRYLLIMPGEERIVDSELLIEDFSYDCIPTGYELRLMMTYIKIVYDDKVIECGGCLGSIGD